jgi:predicted ferric reductase
VGYLGVTAIVVQIVLPSRAPSFTTAFGPGVLLRLHRSLGSVVLAFVVLHVAVFVWRQPHYAAWLLPLHERSFKALAGFGGAAALLLIVLSSWWRGLLRIRYEHWRALHLVLGTLALAAATTHVLLISWSSKDPLLRWFVVGAFAVGLISLGYLRVARPFVALARPFVVEEVRHERGAATTLQLAAVGHAGTPFQPGQFAWLKLPGSPFTVAEHPFSYASSAARPDRPSFTMKRRGDFTDVAWQLPPGTQVLIDGPHGSWRPTLPEAGFVLVVAGVGITPAMSVVRTHAEVGDLRPVQLVYGARALADVTFLEELQQLAARLPLDLQIVLSQPEPGWTGHVGRIDRDLLARVLAPDARLRNVLVCGPPAMIDGTMAALDELGVDPALVYADRFDSA